MGMFVACIHEQFLVHLAPEAIFRQHTFNGPFDDGIRTAFEKALGRFFLFTTGVTGEIDVDLVFQLIPRKFDLIGVEKDDEVAAINVWGVIGFVFASEDRCDFGTHAANGLISTVYNIPVALHGSLVRMFGGEM